ncbi:MAG: cytochrome c3 family protein [Motiliproteus sp.]
MRLANKTTSSWFTVLLLCSLLASLPKTASAARESDITNTRHNLGTTAGSRLPVDVVNPAAGTTEICVFCHTPHGASTAPDAPLWNRQLSAEASYIPYTASSLDVPEADFTDANRQPTGASKLCLSCHDGTLAMSSTSVNNAPGSGGVNATISGINNLSTNKNLGADLTNDHPISVTFDSELGLNTRDGEMRILDSNQQYAPHIGRREDGKFTLPLQSTGTAVSGEPGQVQCTTCHDPHLAGSDLFTSGTDENKNIKFLRTNRFQTSDPTGTLEAPVADGDIICVYCHTKGATGDGFASWKESAHANPLVADEAYESGTNSPASEREFPDNIKVWEAACLNCHDTHTASGQKKLLRKKSADGSGDQENTCYQCHDTGAGILTANTGTVPNIKAEFGKTIRMPITTGDQANGANSSEVHEISDADFSETAANLGLGINKRHAECTDCHNPHRVVRNSRFNMDGVNDTASANNDRATEAGNPGSSTADLRTHQTGINATSDGNNDGREGNVASGVLRGAWGIEPIPNAPSDRFLNTSLGYRIVSGDPGAGATPNPQNDYLTREYQLCFKCHSNFAFANTPPFLDDNLGGTPADNSCSAGSGAAGSANCMTQYTNVMAEFASVDATIPATTGTDQGEDNTVQNNGDLGDGTTNVGTACIAAVSGTGIEPTSSDCAPNGSFTLGSGGTPYNHRSWHPVMFPTGRDRGERGMNATATDVNFKPPWADNIGTQTMQCSDCHGGETSYIQGRGAERDVVQGPHGSDNKFLLKSETINFPSLWQPGGIGSGTSLGGQDYGMCGNCHQPRASNQNNRSGLDGDGSHVPDGNMGRGSCMMCHIAVPHGWKNKQFLINLLCVGSEADNGPNTKSAGECVDSGGYGGSGGGGEYDTKTYRPYYIGARLRVPLWAPSGDWGSENCGGGNMEDGCPESD